MPGYIKDSEPTPIVHIEVQPSGSATMTFKGSQFEGKVMPFKHPRDAEAHARHNGFETIQRKTHPQYFAVIPWYSAYGQKSWEMDGNSKDEVQEDDQSTQGSNW
jgi:hypothetical protein